MRALFLVFVISWLRCHEARFHDVSLPQTYFVTNPLDQKVHEIKVIDGISLWNATYDLCQTLSVEECIDLTYSISYQYYGNIYFPMHPNSCIEDYYYQRKDLITYVTKRFQYQSYLEIGCDQNQTFGKIQNLFQKAICVDPSKGGTVRMTSDEFFHQNTDTFDVIFIDGLHEAHQVWRDVMSSLNVLNENGLIILHDLNPLLEKYQVTPEPPGPRMIWNGDCWKAAIALRLFNELDIVVGDFDQGIGILRKKANQLPLPKEWSDKLLEYISRNTDPNSFLNAISFAEFHENRQVLHRFMTVAEVRVWLEQ